MSRKKEKQLNPQSAGNQYLKLSFNAKKLITGVTNLNKKKFQKAQMETDD